MNDFLTRSSRLMLVLVAFSISSCHARTTGKITDSITMTRVLQTALPFGTELSTARTFMEHEGFHCTPQTNARWGDRSHLDYLYCERSDGSIVQRHWQVAIVYYGKYVFEVLVTTDLVGP